MLRPKVDATVHDTRLISDLKRGTLEQLIYRESQSSCGRNDLPDFHQT